MQIQTHAKSLWIGQQSTDLEVILALKVLERVRGLLFKPPLKKDEGLLIAPCNSVHMLGMRYAIDVVFLDPSHKVLKLVPDLKPWRMAICLRSVSVLELPLDSIARLGLNVGDQLAFK